MEAKTKKNLIIWGVVILVILNLSSLGTIWYHRYNFKKDLVNRERMIGRRMAADNKRNERPRQWNPRFLFGDIDLSDEQQAQFKEVWGKYSEQRWAIREEMETNRREIGKLMSSPEIDTIKYNELANQQADLFLRMDKAMVDMNLELRGLLNEEQLPIFLKQIEKMNERRLGGPSDEHRSRRKSNK